MLNSAGRAFPPALALHLLVAALAAVGCGERGLPRAVGAAVPQVTVQGAGDQPAVLEKQAQRIVALDPVRPS